MPEVKMCDHCSRATYRVKGFWSSDETYYVCCGCNINEEECQCPAEMVSS